MILVVCMIHGFVVCSIVKVTILKVQFWTLLFSVFHNVILMICFPYVGFIRTYGVWSFT